MFDTCMEYAIWAIAVIGLVYFGIHVFIYATG